MKAVAEACAYDSPTDVTCSSAQGTVASQLVPPTTGEKEVLTPASDIPSLCDLPEAKAQADIKVIYIFFSNFFWIITVFSPCALIFCNYYASSH